MNKESFIQRTLLALSKLPEDKAHEVANFADYILKQYDEEIMQKGIEKIVSQSKSYDFLKDEEDLYRVEDLKERYK